MKYEFENWRNFSSKKFGLAFYLRQTHFIMLLLWGLWNALIIQLMLGIHVHQGQSQRKRDLWWFSSWSSVWHHKCNPENSISHTNFRSGHVLTELCNKTILLNVTISFHTYCRRIVFLIGFLLLKNFVNEWFKSADREIDFFTSVTTLTFLFWSHDFLCDRKTNEIRKIGGRLDYKVGCFREQYAADLPFFWGKVSGPFV